MKNKYKLIFLVAIFLVLNFSATDIKARKLSQDFIDETISTYRQYKIINEVPIVVPTVVEIPLLSLTRIKIILNLIIFKKKY